MMNQGNFRLIHCRIRKAGAKFCAQLSDYQRIRRNHNRSFFFLRRLNNRLKVPNIRIIKRRNGIPILVGFPQ